MAPLGEVSSKGRTIRKVMGGVAMGGGGGGGFSASTNCFRPSTCARIFFAEF